MPVELTGTISGANATSSNPRLLHDRLAMRPSFLSIPMVPGIRNDLNRPQLEDGSRDR